MHFNTINSHINKVITIMVTFNKNIESCQNHNDKDRLKVFYIEHNKHNLQRNSDIHKITGNLLSSSLLAILSF